SCFAVVTGALLRASDVLRLSAQMPSARGLRPVRIQVNDFSRVQVAFALACRSARPRRVAAAPQPSPWLLLPLNHRLVPRCCTSSKRGCCPSFRLCQPYRRLRVGFAPRCRLVRPPHETTSRLPRRSVQLRSPRRTSLPFWSWH